MDAATSGYLKALGRLTYSRYPSFVYTVSSIPMVSAVIKLPTKPNSVHSVLAAEYQKETAEQPHLTVNLKLFDASGDYMEDFLDSTPCQDW